MTKHGTPEKHPVLLMEDDHGVGSGIKEILEMRLPVKVKWVQNLADAEHALLQQTFSSVITDGEFPRTAPREGERPITHPLGVQFIEKIRSDHSQTIPILFQTARAEYFAAATAAGATACIQKPSRPQSYIQFLEKELLQNKSPHR